MESPRSRHEISLENAWFTERVTDKTSAGMLCLIPALDLTATRVIFFYFILFNPAVRRGRMVANGVDAVEVWGEHGSAGGRQQQLSIGIRWLMSGDDGGSVVAGSTRRSLSPSSHAASSSGSLTPPPARAGDRPGPPQGKENEKGQKNMRWPGPGLAAAAGLGRGPTDGSPTPADPAGRLRVLRCAGGSIRV